MKKLIPTAFVVAEGVPEVVAWFLAGLAIAKIIRARQTEAGAS